MDDVCGVIAGGYQSAVSRLFKAVCGFFSAVLKYKSDGTWS